MAFARHFHRWPALLVVVDTMPHHVTGLTKCNRVRGMVTLAACAVLLFGGGLWAFALLQGSLPVLSGKHTMTTLHRDVQIERDQFGVVTVVGQGRDDVARGLGFVHAQERFFQMDLLRRAAAGELAELFGNTALELDKQVRVHGLRRVAQAAWDTLEGRQREIILAYVEGVNEGLAQLASEPFEYIILRQHPRSWQPPDCFLVGLAMFLDLQDDLGERHEMLALLGKLYPNEMLAFLIPRSTEWDSPLRGAVSPVSPLPSNTVFNPRETFKQPARPEPRAAWMAPELEFSSETQAAASNSWAVDDDRSTRGRAMVAGDMHLNLRVPTVWFRAQLKWFDTDANQLRSVMGVTLPGGPIVVAGSTGKVAWAFTNSYADTTELIELELQTMPQPRYRTAEGWTALERREERIAVKGARPVVISVPISRWGPTRVLADGTHVAVRWVGHDPQAVNYMTLMDMESAQTRDEAIAIGQQAGIPAQNIVVADDRGQIGWTLAGFVPRRTDSPDRPLTAWPDADTSWAGRLEKQDYPRIVDPDNGRLWTANNRILNDEGAVPLGDGGYALGARARQIRDRLMAQDKFSETDMLDIQLDDRALFLERWRLLLLEILSDDAVRGYPQRGVVRDRVAAWSGRASINDAGYRMVRAFRQFLAVDVFEVVLNRAHQVNPTFPYQRYSQWEAPLWQIVTERPLHYLHPNFSTWNEQFLHSLDRLIATLEQSGPNLAERTWGERNRLAMNHPFAIAVPWLAKWLNMPSTPLPGDDHMPRVQGPSTGSSQRMVVAPGQEKDGIMHMPGGQSGHPLSPFYRAGHQEWEQGSATPFLPGAPRYRMTLTPPANGVAPVPWWRDAPPN